MNLVDRRPNGHLSATPMQWELRPGLDPGGIPGPTACPGFPMGAWQARQAVGRAGRLGRPAPAAQGVTV